MPWREKTIYSFLLLRENALSRGSKVLHANQSNTTFKLYTNYDSLGLLPLTDCALHSSSYSCTCVLMCINIVHLVCTLCMTVSREEMGMFAQKPSYMALMKIIANVQNKIDGWEVRITRCDIHAQ